MKKFPYTLSRVFTGILTFSLVFNLLGDPTLNVLAVPVNAPHLDTPDCQNPPNEIVAENCLQGNPPSEWDVTGAGDENIQGFATDISVNRGETIEFKIDTTAPEYEIKIYRLGYYDGNGARLVATIPSTAVAATDQPACSLSAILIGGGSSTSGQLLDCGNWSVSASWQVPVDATSGVYIARPTRTDNNEASHIPFIVRDDASTSDLIFQTSDTTWQSYNPYGGYNAYGSSGAVMAEKLSYNRPFATRGAELENYLFNAEYPMIRWLERNGYDVSYFSAVDTERHAELIDNHKVFLSVGHDEYWSQGRRDAVTAARDAGVHLAFFSANEIYWKIRWEASTADGGSTDYRTQVVYKEGSSAPSGSAEHRNCYNNYNCDPSPIWTGQWREAPGTTPENSVSGQISWRLTTPGRTITVPAEYAPLRFWRDTAVAALGPGGQATLGGPILGYEWDPEYPQYANWYPAGRILLSSTDETSFAGPDKHHLSLYRAASGALVFGAGTVQWSWGLDANHDYGASTEDRNVQQATVNLFADMGVQPGSLQADLVHAAASTDSTPPTVTVTSPASGSSVPGGTVTITGTASDLGGVVGVVEISTNGGTTWRRASGRENWSYTYSASEGAVDIRVRAADDSVNLGSTVTHTFNVSPRECPCSIWNDTITPTNLSNDGQALEVGVKFQSSEVGRITGLRFYKDAVNTGTHTGYLWASDGTQLAEAVFTDETVSGWQEVYFAVPVEILADTTYVASYYSSSGYYSHNDNYFTSAYVSSPLRALADGEQGGNGIYKYGVSGFPTLTSSSANYWVDVIFDDTPLTYSIWERDTISGDPDAPEPVQVELGLKFKSDVSGSVTGVAFYKGATNTGPFLGHLWTRDGLQLAEKSYTNGTAEEGWQVITFDTPVSINANTTYVVSYFTQSGNYAAAGNYFTTEVYNAPLRALANSDPDGPNGVFNYDIGGGFPTGTFNAGNYWVDVLFTPDAPIDLTPPTVLSTTPANGATGVNVNNNITVRFSEAMDAASITGLTFELRDAGSNLMSATVTYTAATRTATLDPNVALAYSTTYTATVKGGTGGVSDLAGNELAADYTWTLNTSAPPPPPPDEGPGGPILVVASAANPFGRYYAEILHNEGLNEFTVTDISNVDAVLLGNYQVVILGEMALTAGQVSLFTDWVTAGGNLIAMRPDKQLAGLLGLTDAGSTLSNAYLLVNTASGPGAGIVDETIQFHGAADLYTLNGATSLAALYSDATTSTANPAVTLVSVGANGGQVAAFTYDLARSVVYTRQGNPAWAGDERDGTSPVRSNDMFYGAKAGDVQPDWIDLNKVQVPQADEQQRLLANLILQMNLDEMPLPRFWYFPRGEKAVVVMTGDDHASSIGTATHFDWFASQDEPGCSVNDWECIRSTSYIYTHTPLSVAAAAAYEAQGFEVSIHVNTGCGVDWTPETLPDFYTIQLYEFGLNFPLVPAPSTHRTHCIAWSDWATQPQVELDNGIRFDVNYYYWPESWVQSRPGYFTGSGMPMRFAELGGTMIDVYQATTQMPDESGLDYQSFVATLLDNALGAPGYYGVITTNIHTDRVTTPAQTIVAEALSRNVPVISARQMLTWLDGRNGSSFQNLSWDTDTLSFTVSVGAGANGLQAMVPMQSAAGPLNGITRGGNAVSYTQQTIKGVNYAILDAQAGDYAASYEEDTTPPVVNSVSPTEGAIDVPVNTTVTATFNEPMDAATVSAGTFELRAPGDVLIPATVAYNAGTNIVTLTPDAILNLNATYTATVKGGASGVADAAGIPLASDKTWSFTTSDSTYNCPCSIWGASGGGGSFNDGQPIELGVKFRSSAAGYITGIRFYKGVSAAGSYTGKLYTSTGTLLGTVNFPSTSNTGWQEVLFSQPVQIAANTTYVASYFSQSGDYVATSGYFTSSGFGNPPLLALQDGVDGPNGVYNFGSAGFPTTTYNATNYWVDVVFDATAPADTTPPVITNVSAMSNGDGTALITWTTDEPADSTVDYGTVSGAPNLSSSTGTLVTSHAITLSGLTAGENYFFTVTSKDASSNSATSDESSFTTPTQLLGDTSAADFSAALWNTCYIAEADDGEVILPPTVGTEFDGSTLPAGWSNTSWTGGTSTVSGAQVFVDGARAAPDTYYTPGRSLEFVATFRTETFQNVGFGQDLATTAEYWAMFGMGNTANGLYARTNVNGTTTDTLLAGSWLGAPHRYRIEWTASQILFYIDGSLVHIANIAITQTMRPLISDYQISGTGVTVDWMHMSAYGSACSLTSKVFDMGGSVVWDAMSWTGEVPTGTSLNLSYRIGDSPNPDAGWSSFLPVGVSPAAIDSSMQYIQYKADLAASDNTRTPVLKDVSFTSHNAVLDATVTVITADTPDPSEVGQTVAVSVTVTGTTTPTGLVEITGADSNCALTLSDGSGTCNVTFASAGAKTLTATYFGDGTHDVSSDIESHVVILETTLPTIIDRSPVPDATGIALDANVTVTFSEAMDAGTITDTTFTLRASGAGSDVPAVVSYAGGIATLNPSADLIPLTTYQVTVVSTVTDLAGNPLGADDAWTFTTGAMIFSAIDTTVADFSAGTVGACVVDGAIGNGALRLPLTLDEDFLGTSLPDGWSGYQWTGGTWTVSDGSLAVDGASARNDMLFTPGRSLEFVATFKAEAYQHVGFGGSEPTFNDAPIVMFSTRQGTTTLYTSTFFGSYDDVPIPNGSSLIGSPHLYRIDWKTDGFDFYVDGTLVSSRTSTVSGSMRVAASDFNIGGTSLTVDWIRLSPYISPCTFESRVLDAGYHADWLDLSWAGLSPTGSMVSFETRSGVTASPDASWSAWQAVDEIIASPNGQYIQYRATLATANVSQTLFVESVTLTNIPVYPLTIVKTGNGSGRVVSVPGGIDCGEDCSEDYLYDTVVTLTANPDPGSVFTFWLGGGCRYANPCVTTVRSARTITVSFRSPVTLGEPGGAVSDWDNTFNWTGFEEATNYVLELYTSSGTLVTSQKWYTASGAGCVAPDLECSVTIPLGTLADGEYKWRVRDYGAGTYENGAWTDYKNFTLNRCYALEGVTNPEAGGTVNASVQNCSGGYTAGTVVEVTAEVNDGYVFGSWSGDASGSTNPVQVTMNGDKQVVANLNSSAIVTLTPAETLTNWDNSFAWSGVSGATNYVVELRTSAGTLVTSQKWYTTSAANCVSPDLDCAVTMYLGTLANGDYKWRVRDYNNATYTYGIWTGYKSFTLNIPPPPPPLTALTPADTLVSWDNSFTWSGVSNATNYVVELRTAAGTLVTSQKWYTTSAANCVSPDLDCTVTMYLGTLANGEYKWRVRNYNNTTYAYGAWTEYKSFTLSIPPPPPPVTALIPAEIMTSWDNSFLWSGVSNATNYVVELYTSTGTLVTSQKWYTTSAANCVAPDLDCTVTMYLGTLANGDYKWRVRSYNNTTYTYGTWTDYKTFILSR